MLTCEKCGREIIDVQAIQRRFGNVEVKYCEPCRRAVRIHRVNVNVERRELAFYPNVLIDENVAFRQEKKPAHGSVTAGWGGRMFGRWGGDRHEGKAVERIDLSLVDQEKAQEERGIRFTCDRCAVRVMEKSMEGQTWRYIVLEPAQEDQPVSGILAVLRSWRKTTLRGIGRDRDYSETIECSYDVIAEHRSRANSDRFGNYYRLIIAQPEELEEFEIVGHGVA